VHGFAVNIRVFYTTAPCRKRNNANYLALFVQVYIKYVGMLKEGKIVESNLSEKPYKFKLGNIFANIHPCTRYI
jgi:hypothetical protein